VTSFPHGIDASADGRFVAITNYGDDTLRIMRLAPEGLRVQLAQPLQVERQDPISSVSVEGRAQAADSFSTS
jgi:hypothetical protein